MRRGQASIEFMLIMGIMFFIFIGFVAITSSRMISLQEERYYRNLKETADSAALELRLASIMEDGYARQFDVPNTAFGKQYSLALYTRNGSVNNTFLFSKYVNFSVKSEIVVSLPNSIRGNLYKGRNNITKLKGVVCLNNATCA